MTVESYVMVRARRDPVDDSWGPRQDDLAPYTLSGEDVTARASDISDGALHLNTIEAPPQVMVWRYRMSNADALAMSTDPKVWMIESRRYSIDEEGNEVEQDNNRDDPYDPAERTLRINQLGNITDFDAATIENWWAPDKTHRGVALKLRNYLKTLNAEG